MTDEHVPGAARKDPAMPDPGPPRRDGVTGPDPALIQAINQVFALFRINYHNQYYAAFSDAEQLRQIKKLWLDSLKEYAPAQILQGARHAIDNGEYLPTLHRMRSCCDEGLPALGLPTPRRALLEAANAGDPAEARQWSHPLVYWAGRDSGFRRLATLSEPEAMALFRGHYQRRCRAYLEGTACEPVPGVPEPRLDVLPLERDAAMTRVRQLRSEHEL